MTFPFTGIGHAVVIVGKDSVRGFKIKSSNEDSGEEIWIPFDRMTWFQCCATEEEFKRVRFGPPVWDAATNKMIFSRTDRPRVIQELKNAHRMETGEELDTEFTQRAGYRILDYGFVLKFKKNCNCTEETCDDSDNSEDSVSSDFL